VAVKLCRLDLTAIGGALLQGLAVGEGKRLTLFGGHLKQGVKSYGQNKMLRFLNFQKFVDRT